MPIQSFKCKETKKLFEGKRLARFKNFQSVAERKLQLLDSAGSLAFLRSPPSNHLEALKGGRKGEHSIRINDQFRLCFVWTDAGPTDVEIVDHH